MHGNLLSSEHIAKALQFRFVGCPSIFDSSLEAEYGIEPASNNHPGKPHVQSRRVLPIGGKQGSLALHMACFETVLYHIEPL